MRILMNGKITLIHHIIPEKSQCMINSDKREKHLEKLHYLALWTGCKSRTHRVCGNIVHQRGITLIFQELAAAMPRVVLVFLFSNFVQSSKPDRSSGLHASSPERVTDCPGDVHQYSCIKSAVH